MIFIYMDYDQKLYSQYKFKILSRASTRKYYSHTEELHKQILIEMSKHKKRNTPKEREFKLIRYQKPKFNKIVRDADFYNMVITFD